MNRLTVVFLLMFVEFCIFCQVVETKKNIPIDKFQYDIVYGFCKFAYPIDSYNLINNPLTIKFSRDNSFQAFSGKGFIGKYSKAESNKCTFFPEETTLEYQTVSIDGGQKFCPYLFFDSLMLCNNYKISEDELLFYKDSQFMMALKPFINLIDFNNSSGIIPENVKISDVEMGNRDGFIIIDSDIKMKKYRVKLHNSEVNFDSYGLVIISNLSIQENKSRLYRRAAKIYKKQNEPSLYPVSYARLSQNSLEVINTYNNTNPFDNNRRSKYTGYLINKDVIAHLKVLIEYKD